MHSWTRDLAVVFLSLLGVFLLAPSTLASGRPPPKRVAIRTFCGEPLSSIPPQLIKTAVPVSDWRELKRWGISESRVPRGGDAQFLQPTFWEQHKWLIVLVLALCLFEAALIGLLLRERRRRRRAQQRLEERVRFEQLVSELSNTFINLPPERVEAQIIEALGQVANLLRFDIAALSVFTGRGTEGRVAYLWRAEGVPEIPSDLTDKDFPWVAQELFTGRDVCLRTLEMLPLAARTDRDTYERYHVRSAHNVAVVAGGQVIGVLGLCTVWEEREMSRELLQSQRLLGEIFANALARKAAEESRRESERSFRSLVETTAAVPWQADIESWVFTYVGPQAVRLLGYPLEQWYEKDFLVSHLHPDDKEFAINTCLGLSQSAEDFEFEYRMMASSGKIVWVHDIVRCERRDGKPVELRGFMLDITQRKQAEEALRDSEERMSLAANTAGLGLWVWDATRDESWVTPEGRRLFGWDESEAVTLERFIRTLHPDDREPTREAILRSLQNGGDYVAEYRVVLSGGAIRWITTRGRVEFDANGRPRRLRGVSIDITDRKRSESELQRNRQELAHVTRISAMGELAASLAHELNQPLTAILGNAQAAQRFMAANPVDLEEVREILQDIVQADSRASEVIQRIRALLKKEEVAFEPLNIAEVTHDVARLIHTDAVLLNVDVAIELNPALPLVLGDRVQLQQVVLNLMLNAFDAVKDCPANERRIVLQAEPDDTGALRVAVRDRGIGLNGAKLDKIFQPFYTTKRDGLGMGLSISRSIVEDHGGRLWAENNPDRGATFYFTVPAAERVGEKVSSNG